MILVNRAFLLVYTLVFLLAAASSLPAQDDAASALSVTIDKDSVEIGEPIRMTLSISGSGEFDRVDVVFPQQQKNAVVAETFRPTGPREFSGTIRMLRPVQDTLGPVTARLYPVGSDTPLEVRSSTFAINVVPLDGEPKYQVSDYTAPLSLPFDFFWRNVAVIAGALVFLMVVAMTIATLIYVLRRRTAARVIEPPLPPVESALIGVRGLATLDVYTQFGADRHYTALSSVMRTYFEHQFGVHALEMTEDEVCGFLQYELAHHSMSSSLVDVLTRTSLAKFARQPITEGIARDDCRMTEAFLLSEKERLAREAALAKGQIAPRDVDKTEGRAA